MEVGCALLPSSWSPGQEPRFFPFLSQLLFRYSLPQCLTHFSSIVCACTLEPGVSRTTGWVVSTKQMSEQIFPPLEAFQQVLISEQPMALSPAWSGIFPLHPSVTRPLWRQLWLLHPGCRPACGPGWPSCSPQRPWGPEPTPGRLFSSLPHPGPRGASVDAAFPMRLMLTALSL